MRSDLFDVLDELLESGEIELSNHNSYTDELNYAADTSDEDVESHIKDISEQICTFMIDNQITLRICSDNLEIPLTTLHRYIHKYVKEYFPCEYHEIVKLLAFNKQYRRKPRKYWRLKP